MTLRTAIGGALMSAVLVFGAQPRGASTREMLPHGIRLVHKKFTYSDMSSVRMHLGDDARKLALSGFAPTPPSSDDKNSLDEFVATVATQAQIEGWKALDVEIWVGGKESAAGYFVRYYGQAANDAPVMGEAFLTTDRDALRQNLRNYRDIIGDSAPVEP